MMYCRRCNNTHWAKTQARNALDRLALLILRRPYQCNKCERIQLGSIFIDIKARSRKRQRRILQQRTDHSKIKCPECGGTVHRCRRRTIERLLVFTRAYRCFKCEARFWRFTPV
jgi:uncharacterized protein with PIN domain